MISRALISLIKIYKRIVSPFLPGRCRFHPTCSEFAAEAIRVHGVIRGLTMATGRLLRCHPLHEGGFDPVPEPRERFLLRPYRGMDIQAAGDPPRGQVEAQSERTRESRGNCLQPQGKNATPPSKCCTAGPESNCRREAGATTSWE